VKTVSVNILIEKKIKRSSGDFEDIIKFSTFNDKKRNPKIEIFCQKMIFRSKHPCLVAYKFSGIFAEGNSKINAIFLGLRVSDAIKFRNYGARVHIKAFCGVVEDLVE